MVEKSVEMNIATLLQVGLPSTRVMAPPATLTNPTSTPPAFVLLCCSQEEDQWPWPLLLPSPIRSMASLPTVIPASICFSTFSYGKMLHRRLLHGGVLAPQEPHQDAGRLHSDPDYKLLHDAVMDLFLKRLEYDVDKIMQHKLQLKPSNYLTDEEDEFKEDEDDDDSTFDPHRFVTEAAACLVTKHPTASHAARSILLCESIAKRLFTPKSDKLYELEEWEKLGKLVLAPLRNYWYRQGMFDHRWSWVFEKQKLWHLQTAVNSDRQRSYEVEKYLEEVKVAAARGGGGIGIIKPDALVLGEIIKYVCYADFREVVSVEGNVGGHKTAAKAGAWAMSLGLVVSELSEELVWKGKVITFGDSQHELLLHSIQGDDLKSKAKFMMRTNKDFSIANFPEACDLILKVAVNENLKPEQMVKKVFVFTDFSCRGIDWKPSYEAVFLDNGGEIGPHQLMEAAIADKEYQALSVVD
ncbi:PREDICTED: LOW QUALITY PROTEIN [Prunus dulcis]|uniref:PREDICTED: LOW QUALITY PROTEIN n=1 Tax=Prunus dulcis TaxID=3755 RepID=A0A5E4G545_PRUDU|nr:PREDICTED: LOW QUALITY PROTEIN [Prunus dulcis]